MLAVALGWLDALVLAVALVLVQALGELDVLVLAVAFGWCRPAFAFS